MLVKKIALPAAEKEPFSLPRRREIKNLAARAQRPTIHIGNSCIIY